MSPLPWKATARGQEARLFGTRAQAQEYLDGLGVIGRDKPTVAHLDTGEQWECAAGVWCRTLKAKAQGVLALDPEQGFPLRGGGSDAGDDV